MDEGIRRDFEGRRQREVEAHRKVLPGCYDFLRKRGATMSTCGTQIKFITEPLTLGLLAMALVVAVRLAASGDLGVMTV